MFKTIISILTLGIMLVCCGCSSSRGAADAQGQPVKELSLMEKAELAIDTIKVCIDVGMSISDAEEKADVVLQLLQKNEDKLDPDAKAALELFMTAKRAVDESSLDKNSPEGKALKAKENKALIDLLTGLRDNQRLPADLRQAATELLDLYANSADKIKELFFKLSNDPEIKATMEQTIIETLKLEGFPYKDADKGKAAPKGK